MDKNGQNHHMKITLKLYAKVGKYLPDNASKNQAVIEIEEGLNVEQALNSYGVPIRPTPHGHGEWCSHHARGKNYKGPFRVRQFSSLATNYRLVLLDHQGIRQCGLIFRG